MSEPSADAELTDPHAEPEIVATHAHRGEAEVTKAHLAANGVDAEIIDGVAGGTMPVDGQDGVLVMVAADQAEVARAFLADVTYPEGDRLPPSTI